MTAVVADFGLARVFHPLGMSPSTNNKKRLPTPCRYVACTGCLSVTASLSLAKFFVFDSVIL